MLPHNDMRLEPNGPENVTCCARTVYIHRELYAILGADETSSAAVVHDLSGCARPRDGVSASLHKVVAGAVAASEEEAADVLELRLLQRLRVLEGCDVARLLEPFCRAHKEWRGYEHRLAPSRL